ncbi:hypothetical protein EG68_10735 [Paragonimus skrjabini miyazakii]|uniref:CBM21 domain-containing protein n=1 Tax=Paragonimus skrjabini miyazakii TaxID=59628 RepID=A0A8S9YHJ9_9TREM|nr:hypothetical protein EG68_10735 [Paragonimus skrjabini miyazakii]
MSEKLPCSGAMDVLAAADRHHGWHTEYNFNPQVPFGRSKKAADYVVRTSLRDKPGGKKCVNLVLRFRSLLPRRIQPHTGDQRLHRKHENVLASFKVNRKVRRASHAVCSEQRSLPLLKRAKSDSCINHLNVHTHVKLADACLPDTHSSSSSSAVSTLSENVPEMSAAAATSEVNGDALNRFQSLSTGNICCLFALHCLPSVEYLTTSLNHLSPLTAQPNLQVSSLKSTANRGKLPPSAINVEKHFVLDRLKQHPCYQDVNRKLNEWVRKTLEFSERENAEGCSKPSSSRKMAGESYNGYSDWNRHVRFADETNCSSSATTLNSLSASSSILSLSSMASNVVHYSPQASMIKFPSSSHTASPISLPNTNAIGGRAKSPLVHHTRDFFRKLNPNRWASQDTKADVLSIKDLSLGRLKTDHKNKSSLSKRLSFGSRRRRHRENKTIPMVTVNVIQDYSEPPEIPTHVLKSLQKDKSEPHWINTFPNPDECTNFYHRLVKQRICLGRLRSHTLSSVEVQVHVISNDPFDKADTRIVQLRYTLNSWATFADSESLKKIFFEKKRLSMCETLWVEIYEGTVKLEVNVTGKSDGTDQIGRFEFAIVSQLNGQEVWDNNGQQNYICVQDN